MEAASVRAAELANAHGRARGVPGGKRRLRPPLVARLHAADRELVSQEADSLALQIKQHLGHTGGIELLAKIGMLLVEKGTQ